MKGIVLSLLATAGVVVIVSRCGAIDRLKGKTSAEKPNVAAAGCAVFATASSVSAGSSVDLTVKDGFDWSKIKSITIDESATLTKASPKTTVVVKSTHKYVAVTTAPDDSTTSCTVEVQVAGTTANDLSCTIAALPTQAPAGGGQVTLTLQVVGSGVTAATINGQTVPVVGGALAQSVTKATSFVGKVNKGDDSATCVVDVALAGTAPAVNAPCKLKPDSTDIAALAAKQSELDAANATAEAAALAGVVASHSLTLKPDITALELKSSVVDLASVCAAITAAKGAQARCELAAGFTDDSNQFRSAVDGSEGTARLLLETDAGKMLVYGWAPFHFFGVDKVYAALTAGGEPRALHLAGRIVPGGELPFDQCLCDADGSSDGNSGAGEAIMAARPVKIFLFPVTTFPAKTTALRLPVAYDVKTYEFKFRKVEPPVGTPRPKCVIIQPAAT